MKLSAKLSAAAKAREVVPCPFGKHLVLLYDSGKVVPHYDNYGEKCEANNKDYFQIVDKRPGDGVFGE